MSKLALSLLVVSLVCVERVEAAAGGPSSAFLMEESAATAPGWTPMRDVAHLPMAIRVSEMPRGIDQLGISEAALHDVVNARLREHEIPLVAYSPKSLGRLGGHRQARLVHRSLMTGECSTARGRSGTVMRHFLPARAFAAPAPVAALTLGMTVSAASRVLIPASRRTHRFAPSEVAATRPAVLLAPITARADEHLAPAPGTQKQSHRCLRSVLHGCVRQPRTDSRQVDGSAGAMWVLP